MSRKNGLRLIQISFIILFLLFVGYGVVTLILLQSGNNETPQVEPTRVVVATPTNRPTQTPIVSEGMESAPTATPNPQNFELYTVRQGDTLTSIASQFGVTVNNLVQANGLEQTNRIDVGQTLVVPADGAFSVVSVAATVESLAAAQAAISAQSTAVAADLQAFNQELVTVQDQLAQVETAVAANRTRLDLLIAQQPAQEEPSGIGWLDLLSGPLIGSLLALAGFATTTFFDWREDQRDAATNMAELERQKKVAELRLLQLQIKAKEAELRQPERPSSS